ncbi:MAG TPA: hypothetical protein VIQ00_02680 [Chitinophagaceae bacterium]
MTVTQDLSIFFIGMYNKKKSTLNFLFEAYVPKHIFKREYEIMIRFYGLEPIENLNKERKKELVSECRATGIFFTNQTLIEAAKTLHVIQFLNEK